MPAMELTDQLRTFTREQLTAAKATDYCRLLSCLYKSGGREYQALQLFQHLYPRAIHLDIIRKAATLPGTGSDAVWGGPLAPLKPLADGFLEYARASSLIGKIPGLRTVPLNVSFSVQTGVTAANWVGENAAKSISKATYATVSLTYAKVSDIVVVTDELMRLSEPSAEAVLRDELSAAVNQFVDQQFVLPSKAAVAGVSPASITNGITPITPSGSTAAALKADIGALISQFATNNPDTTYGVLLMRPAEAAMLAGTQAAATVGQSGGSYQGYPVVVSGSMGTVIALIDAHAIYLADNGIELSMSKNATIEMVDAATNPPVAATVVTSLWQQNLVGLRAERFITWARGRNTAVSLISPTGYVPGS